MDSNGLIKQPRVKTFSPLLGTVILLSATLVSTRLMADRKSEPLHQPLDTVARHIAGFTGIDNPALKDETLAQLKPTSYLARTYGKPGMQADVFIAFYAQQRAGESMHSPKHCLPGAGWEIWDYGSTDIRAGGQDHRINKYSISKDGTRMLVLYWYQSKNRIIASEYTGKILLARDALLHNSTAGSIVRIIVPDEPGSLQAARAFASELLPQVQRCLGG
jgi:EpsI family protein